MWLPPQKLICVVPPSIAKMRHSSADEVWSSKISCSSVLVSIFGHLLETLQSVHNVAARLVFSARCSEHLTSPLYHLLLRNLHWLWVPEWMFPPVIFWHTNVWMEQISLTWVRASVRWLTSINDIISAPGLNGNIVPPVCLLGDQAFSVATPQAWNCLSLAILYRHSSSSNANLRILWCGRGRNVDLCNVSKIF